MFRISRFGEVMKHLPRGVFERAVRAQQAEKYRKGFGCWQHLVSMVYAQLSGASSLRVLERSFNAQGMHHYHLGCGRLHRSTLAEANARTDGAVFAVLAQALMEQARGKLARQGRQLLRLIDSSSITLKGEGFAWTRAHRTRHTQGLKLHVMFDPAGQIPLAQGLTMPNVNDIQYARSLAIEPGSIYVFDKAYCDYSWWWRIHCGGARLVSRFKRNARLQVLGERRIGRSARGLILKDQRVRLSNRNPGASRTNPYRGTLRRIEVARAGQAPLVLVTNDLKSSALNIAEHYRQRWQIELFFKWLKQHLRIKSFLGRSHNAVRIQILTALIAYLLVHLDAQAKKITTSLWLYLCELRASLFQRPQIDWHRHRKWRQQRAWLQLHQSRLFA